MTINVAKSAILQNFLDYKFAVYNEVCNFATALGNF